MAENKKTLIAEPEAKCPVMGCIHHEVSQTSSDDVLYKFRTHYRTMKEVYADAMDAMRRKVAQRARTSKPEKVTAIPVREDGLPTDIYSNCEHIKSLEEYKAELALQSEEELLAKLSMGLERST